MINTEKLADVLKGYKEYFAIHWKDEKYKWEAIKHFQEHWDINAPNFLEMFTEATAKTFNLLASMNNLPRGMMIEFIKVDVEAVRSMFLNLFNEDKDLGQRHDEFQAAAEELRSKYDTGSWKNHFQSSNAITTYLWLRYPDKYYIYKYTEVRAVAKALESDFVPKKGAASTNIVGAFNLYNEICDEVSKDSSIIEMFSSHLEDTCYPDPYHKTVIVDVGFFISRFYKKEDQNEWFPKDYNPGISVDAWIELMSDGAIFTESSMEIMKRMLAYGGEATCAQLSVKYGESSNFYNAGSSALAKRIADKTGCKLLEKDNEAAKYWPILYVGRGADNDMEGRYIWKLRDELKAALSAIDLEPYSLYADAPLAEGLEPKNYWWLNANPKMWSFSSISVGEVQTYTLYNENGNKRRIFQNFIDAKAGDIFIGYESHPVKQIVGVGIISRENDGEVIYFKKTEAFSNPVDYSVLKDTPELQQMEYMKQPQGSLFKLTKGEYDCIMDIVREYNPLAKSQEAEEVYTKEDFLSEVYMTEDKYETLVGLLKNKNNLILQGAPGVGKTYAAERLAFSMMGRKDKSRVKFIQFHQNYSYEDFIMGYKPVDDGFKLTNGIFYQFCMEASNHPDKEYFFIIDEINRGNMSKIFGELLMLIEKDYRGKKATMAYTGQSFSVPANLYLIGMMNTADRSLAMIDYALRRRFSFFEMEPGFGSEGFKKYQQNLKNDTFDLLMERITELNREIKSDDSLGSGFCIGHSYFCNQKECTEEWMKSVVYYDIIPMLQEYWFDDANKVQRWENNLIGVFND